MFSYVQVYVHVPECGQGNDKVHMCDLHSCFLFFTLCMWWCWVRVGEGGRWLCTCSFTFLHYICLYPIPSGVLFCLSDVTNKHICHLMASSCSLFFLSRTSAAASRYLSHSCYFSLCTSDISPTVSFTLQFCLVRLFYSFLTD